MDLYMTVLTWNFLNFFFVNITLQKVNHALSKLPITGAHHMVSRDHIERVHDGWRQNTSVSNECPFFVCSSVHSNVILLV